ncbi:hypothetical protein [Actinoplanes sp. NPDC051494]|uniref:hypothetical protein n=1 Tax=Actinoplanes sp. NPDC051494 TaxID=3363907 RepID=UPI0037BBECB1
MTSRRSSAAVLLLGAFAVTACDPHAVTLPTPSTSAATPTTSASTPSATPKSSRSTSPHPMKSSRHPKKSSPHPKGSGPRIVSFRVVQKPKCAEGTAVFRAKAVPLVIAWEITGATGGALSVDDPTGTPGTYDEVGLVGTEEFGFSCGGPVGSTETHKYDIYTVGGGTQKSRSLTVSAKVLDDGQAVTGQQAGPEPDPEPSEAAPDASSGS